MGLGAPRYAGDLGAGGSAIAAIPPDPRRRGPRAVKRGLDVVAAATLLLLAAPLIALACLAIRLESRGSPIYLQLRVGRGGRDFELLKLRTMVRGAEAMGPGLAVDEGDPRITRTGALLRRFSLDELPNLVNVLKGDLSLIGPRPTVRSQVEQYTSRQLGRLAVQPGITGWAQVRGRAALPWHERIELDLWYIEHWSLRLDARILLRTARMLLSGKGLYRGETGGWRPPD